MTFDASIFLSLAFLFGVAAQFKAADGEVLLQRLLSRMSGKVGVLLATIGITIAFSPFVLNDVLVLVITPVIIRYSSQQKVPLAPLVVGEIAFTNISSSLTPYGNPQNLILWQATGITPLAFVEGTWFLLLLAGILALALLLPFRGRPVNSALTAVEHSGSVGPTLYLALVTAGVFGLNTVGASSVVSLGAVFFLGFAFTRRRVTRVALNFDVKSLLTLCLLVGGIAILGGELGPALSAYVAPVASGQEPYSALFMAVVSNIISNVPATQLVLGVAAIHAGLAARIAVEAGLAGSITPLGSFADILALLMVKRSGAPIRDIVVLQFVVGLVAYLPVILL